MKRLRLKEAALAVAAVSCMAGTAAAMEHEFNGRILIKGDATNFDQAGGNDASANATLFRTNPSKSFFFTEQRARLKYTGTLIEDVKVITQFEIDSRWGDTSQGRADRNSTRNQGGAMETDQVNLETKNVYMEFKVPGLPTRAKAGLMPFDDAYKGVFLTTDIAGLMTATKLNNLTVNAGWLRGYDNLNFNGATDRGLPSFTTPATSAPSTTGTGVVQGYNPGKYSLDLGILEAKYAVSKALSVGTSYYLTYSNLDQPVAFTPAANFNQFGKGRNVLHTVGMNAAYNFAAGSIDGFVLFQTGSNPTNNYGQVGQSVTAYAANLAAKVKVGPGTLRSSVLYASGDDGKGSVSAFQGVNQLGNGNATSTYSAAQMTMLITNTKYSANTDRALVNTVSNFNQGVLGGFLGYDLDIDKTFIKTNLGFAAADKDNETFKAKNLAKAAPYAYTNGKYIGTEVNAEVGYKITSNLTASVVGGYVFLGDYYKDTVKNTFTGIAETPDNPWKTQVVLNLTF